MHRSPHSRDSEEATLLLRRLRDGDEDARDSLFAVVFDELRAAARRAMQGERLDHTLQPTVLVHEAWLKMLDGGARYEDRDHFVSVAARAMRQVLVDHARAHRAAKRGSGRARVELDPEGGPAARDGVDLVDLDDALAALAEEDPELARIVELRFFGQLTVKEAASALGVSHRRIERKWTIARSWLYRELGGGSR